MSDNELIEVVKLCCEYNPQCAKCPLEDRDTSDECMGELLKGCLDLINRQQEKLNVRDKLLDIAETRINATEKHCQNLIKMYNEKVCLCKEQRAEIEGLNAEIASLKIANEHLYHINQEHNAECEMLDGNISHWKNLYLNEERKNNTAKSEAVKEFAERLKKNVKKQNSFDFEDVDNLVAEMTESPTKIEHSSLCETESYEVKE